MTFRSAIVIGGSMAARFRSGYVGVPLATHPVI
jgi:hypothetical protein